MTWGWQDVVALHLVFAAMVYLIRAIWRPPARTPAGACHPGECRGCPMTPCARPGAQGDEPVQIRSSPISSAGRETARREFQSGGDSLGGLLAAVDAVGDPDPMIRVAGQFQSAEIRYP